jgi:hypothetical protein
LQSVRSPPSECCSELLECSRLSPDGEEPLSDLEGRGGRSLSPHNPQTSALTEIERAYFDLSIEPTLVFACDEGNLFSFSVPIPPSDARYLLGPLLCETVGDVEGMGR